MVIIGRTAGSSANSLLPGDHTQVNLQDPRSKAPFTCHGFLTSMNLAQST
jgi:hypothetical protein